MFFLKQSKFSFTQVKLPLNLLILLLSNMIGEDFYAVLLTIININFFLFKVIPKFFHQYVKDCGVNGFKAMLCSLRFMGICEERRRQGPSHPVMCLHRNSQHSNLNITLTLTVACFDFKFPFLFHLGVDAISCFFCFCFFVVGLRYFIPVLFASYPKKTSLYFGLIMCGMTFWWVIITTIYILATVWCLSRTYLCLVLSDSI